jgi:hypothetical protein
MAVGVGASGFVGISKETVSGTYVAPTKYLVLTNETLQYQQNTKWRRPLRGVASVTGALAGNAHIEGEISVEVTEDTLPYMLDSARGALVKTGTTPNFIYTFTPNAAALPNVTMSITVVRNGVAFGYVGCVVSQMAFSIDDGTLMCTFSILGRDEATQSVPTPTYVVTSPFGDGSYILEIPTATQVFDCDSFTFTVNDNAEAQYRIKNTRGAQFIKYGERETTMSVERDFQDRTDYDAFKALTAQAILLKIGRGATPDVIAISMPAAIKDTYEISGLTGQADLIRASVAYQGVYDATTSRDYQIVVKTAEDMTP